MRAVIENDLASPAPLELSLYNEAYIRYGWCIFLQLAELRHRGAFSTVAQTFAAWCTVCAKSKVEDIKSLPMQWYQVSHTRFAILATFT